MSPRGLGHKPGGSLTFLLSCLPAPLRASAPACLGLWGAPAPMGPSPFFFGPCLFSVFWEFLKNLVWMMLTVGSSVTHSFSLKAPLLLLRGTGVKGAELGVSLGRASIGTESGAVPSHLTLTPTH